MKVGESNTMDEPRTNILKEEAILYKALSVAFSYPQEESFKTLKEVLSLLVEKNESEELEDFYKALLTSNWENLQEEYSRLFLAEPICSPYESEYEEDKVCGKSRIIPDILGFYRAFGLKRAQKDMSDHIACQLEFLSFLSLKEAYAIENGLMEEMDICAEGRSKFIMEHMLNWIEKFSDCLEANSCEPFYKSLALVLRSFSPISS